MDTILNLVIEKMTYYQRGTHKDIAHEYHCVLCEKPFFVVRHDEINPNKPGGAVKNMIYERKRNHIIKHIVSLFKPLD